MAATNLTSNRGPSLTDQATFGASSQRELLRTQTLFLFRSRAFLQSFRPAFERWLKWLKETCAESMFLLVPGFQMFFRVRPYRRLHLRLLKRMF